MLVKGATDGLFASHSDISDVRFVITAIIDFHLQGHE